MLYSTQLLHISVGERGVWTLLEHITASTYFNQCFDQAFVANLKFLPSQTSIISLSTYILPSKASNPHRASEQSRLQRRAHARLHRC